MLLVSCEWVNVCVVGSIVSFMLVCLWVLRWVMWCIMLFLVWVLVRWVVIGVFRVFRCCRNVLCVSVVSDFGIRFFIVMLFSESV